jgi:Alpha/beta hydrolase domain
MNGHALAALGGLLLFMWGPLHARVTRIVIDQTVSPAFCKGTTCASYGNGDPRLSLQERYGTHAGYVEAVRRAAANAVAEQFLLQKDADALIAAAEASAVLK